MSSGLWPSCSADGHPARTSVTELPGCSGLRASRSPGVTRLRFNISMARVRHELEVIRAAPSIEVRATIAELFAKIVGAFFRGLPLPRASLLDHFPENLVVGSRELTSGMPFVDNPSISLQLGLVLERDRCQEGFERPGVLNLASRRF